jgi:hypothetical protein
MDAISSRGRDQQIVANSAEILQIRRDAAMP